MTEWTWHQKTAEALAELEADPPPIFYHYTTARGLIGMVRDQAIWAGPVEFMNDELEMKYARVVAARVANRMLGGANETGTSNLRSIDDPTVVGLRYYVTSFTPNGDQLSQWRAYGDNGMGFAVGFGTLSGFACTVTSDQFFSARARRVVYDVAKQEGLFEPAIRAALAAAEAGSRDAEDSAWEGAVVEALLSLKNPAFVEEDEWRLVAATGVEWSPPLQIEPSRFGLTQYMRLRYYGREAIESGSLSTPAALPIVHVVAGPRVANTAALRDLMEQAGYWARCETLDEVVAGQRVFLSKSAASYR